MLSLPQPSNGKSKDKFESIDITEDSKTMRHILSLVYPHIIKPLALLSPFEDLVYLICTSIKYDMPLASSRLVKSLIKMTTDNSKDAPKIYVIGCVLGLDEVVQVVSIECLKFNLSELLVVQELWLGNNKMSDL